MDQQRRVHDFLYRQLGKPFHTTALWRNFWCCGSFCCYHTTLDTMTWEADTWFCAELVLAALYYAQGVTSNTMVYHPSKVTPDILWDWCVQQGKRQPKMMCYTTVHTIDSEDECDGHEATECTVLVHSPAMDWQRFALSNSAQL
jgi:hypothetical protein